MTGKAMTIDENSSAWPSAVKEGQPSEASQFDYQLAQRIAGGDMQAFEEFYRRYHRVVYNLCLRMTLNVA